VAAAALHEPPAAGTARLPLSVLLLMVGFSLATTTPMPCTPPWQQRRQSNLGKTAAHYDLALQRDEITVQPGPCSILTVMYRLSTTMQQCFNSAAPPPYLGAPLPEHEARAWRDVLGALQEPEAHTRPAAAAAAAAEVDKKM
jgi:hypothetical protein